MFSFAKPWWIFGFKFLPTKIGLGLDVFFFFRENIFGGKKPVETETEATNGHSGHNPHMYSLTFLSAWFCESHGQCWLRLPEATQNNKCINIQYVWSWTPPRSGAGRKITRLFLYSQATCWWERSWGKNLPPRTRSSRSRPANGSTSPTHSLVKYEVGSKSRFSDVEGHGILKEFSPINGQHLMVWASANFSTSRRQATKATPIPLKCIHPTYLTHRHSLHQQSVHLEFWGGTTMSRLPKKNRGVQ